MHTNMMKIVPGGKPYDGNPCARKAGRFCALPIGRCALVVTAICVATVPSSSWAVEYSLDGGVLKVTASSDYAGKGLKLLWDSTDKGDVVTNWANSTTIVGSVPSAGGTWTVNLSALGIAADAQCRIASCMTFARLDMIKQSSRNCYVNSGISDNDVYGVRFGYYSLAKNENNSSCIGSGSGDGGFSVGANGITRESVSVRWNGTSLSQHPGVRWGSPSDAPDTSKLNEFAFTNGVFTVNGTTVTAALGSGPAGSSEQEIYIGTSQGDAGSRAMHGWWSHVSFDGADGEMLRDYIPVRRGTDNVVGFFDRVSKSFTASTAADAFVAGTPTGETVESDFNMASETIAQLRLSVNKSTLTITVPACCAGQRLTVLWDDSDKGDDDAAWAHSEVISDNAAVGTYTVRMNSLGMRNGQFCRVFAGGKYHPLEMLRQISFRSYIYPDIKDTSVYGVRFGYYPVAREHKNGDAAKYASCIGSHGSAGGFVVYSNNGSSTSLLVKWRGDTLPQGLTVKCGSLEDDPDTSKINEFAFTNGVCTVNGGVVNSSLGAGLAVGTQDKPITIGASNADRGTQAIYGWWSHVSFDDASGERIIDYVPVKRAWDDAVGFFDRVTGKFVTSTGSDGFMAGPVREGPPIVCIKGADTFRVATIPGLIIIFE